MVKVEEARGLLRRIQKKYDEDPNDQWRVLVGRDASGRPTQIIANSSDTWQIKGELVKPNLFAGVGLKLEGITSENLEGSGGPFYGLRPVERDVADRILKTHKPSIVSDVLSRPPIATTSLKTIDALIEGPILQSRAPLVPISQSQRELEMRLDRGLHKLLSSKYPETVYPYG